MLEPSGTSGLNQFLIFKVLSDVRYSFILFCFMGTNSNPPQISVTVCQFTASDIGPHFFVTDAYH